MALSADVVSVPTRKELLRLEVMLFRYALALCNGDAVAAEDLTQETLLRVHVKDKLHPVHIRLMKRIALNYRIDEVRKLNVRARHAEEVRTAGVRASRLEAFRCKRDDLWERILAFLKELPDRLRPYGELRLAHGLSLSAIAERMGFSKATAVNRERELRRALQADPRILAVLELLEEDE